MSRTKKGTKAPGNEYWGRREGLKYGATGKPKSKRAEKQAGKQRERAILKRKLKMEIDSE